MCALRVALAAGMVAAAFCFLLLLIVVAETTKERAQTQLDCLQWVKGEAPIAEWPPECKP